MRRRPPNDKKICYACGTNKTTLTQSKRRSKRWIYENWTYNRDEDKHIIGFLCQTCNLKIIKNPKRRGVYRKNALRFKQKLIEFPTNPRKGICSKCGRKIGEGIKRTNLHHLEYHDNNPLKDTIELCISCHSYESWRLGAHKDRPPMIRDNLGRFIRSSKSYNKIA